MYCYNCGKQIHDEAIACIECGVAAIKPQTVPLRTCTEEKLSGLTLALSIVSVFHTVMVFVLVIFSFRVILFTMYPNPHLQGALAYEGFAIIRGWICVALSFMSGLAAMLLCIILKQKSQRFSAFLSVALSLSSIIFISLINTSFMAR